MIGRLVAGHLRRPRGPVGRLIGQGMARGNAYEAHWTVTLLDLQPADHVLEIGFGPGIGLQQAAEQTTAGVVAGVDYSLTMVRMARRRNAAAIRAGRMVLTHGDIAALPYPDAAFDKAFTIHCIYFWADPGVCLSEVRRVLKTGSRLAVTIMPKDQWPPQRTPPPDLFTLYTVDDVVRLLSTAGFRDVRVECSPQPDQFPGASIVGVK
jgi:ubiquinone/menaquinone biosynthesis C-methylase UbiE